MTIAVSPADVPFKAGPVLIGYLLNWGLYGALSIQVYFYYLSFPKDRWGAKGLVSFVYALETAQTIMITNDCFKTFIKHFGDLETLDAILNEWLTVPVFTAIISCAVQFFYAYRLYILSDRRSIVASVCVLSLMQLISGIITGVHAGEIGSFSGLETARIMQIGEALWLAGSALCDAIIATSMIYILLRKQTSTRSTHNIINKLVRLVIETGTLTAVMALLSLIFYYAFPDKPYHVTAATVLAKMYSNSVLAIFNSRIRIIGGRDDWTDNGQNLCLSLHPGGVKNSSRADSSVAASQLSAIRVQEDIYVHSDAIPLEGQGSYGLGKKQLSFGSDEHF